jgi:hypothetical protein
MAATRERDRIQKALVHIAEALDAPELSATLEKAREEMNGFPPRPAGRPTHHLQEFLAERETVNIQISAVQERFPEAFRVVVDLVSRLGEEAEAGFFGRLSSRRQR